MFFLNIFGKILKILRSNQTPSQIAWGFVLGMVIGMTPFWGLFNLLIAAIIILLRVNGGAAMLAYVIFSAVVYIMDPLLHDLGYLLLVQTEALKPFWTTLYNTPLVPFTWFNNTVYLGSFLVALLMMAPLLFLAKKFVVNYREKYEERVANWKWVKWIKASGVYQWYDRLSNLSWN